MLRDIRAIVGAELFQMSRRVGTWVLLGIWTLMAVFFPYALPYLTDDMGDKSGLMPDRLVSTISTGFPFYGGAIALMLGVLLVGSEFGWGTFKTLFTQGPGRSTIFVARMIALAIVLVPFVMVVFGVAAGASAIIAQAENQAIMWPSISDVLLGMAADWLILAVWAGLGVLLALLSRGTSLAIGVGILYSLMIEGLISNFATSIGWLSWANDVFLRANAYSLVKPFGAGGGGQTDGPGAFAGPYVSATQALVVLTGYVVVAALAAWWVFRNRDVTT